MEGVVGAGDGCDGACGDQRRAGSRGFVCAQAPPPRGRLGPCLARCQRSYFEQVCGGSGCSRGSAAQLCSLPSWGPRVPGLGWVSSEALGGGPA